MRKFLKAAAGIVGLVSCIAHPVIIDNQFKNLKSLIIVENLPSSGTDYYCIMYDKKKNIGNELLYQLVIANPLEKISTTLLKIKEESVSKDTSVTIRDELKPIADLLTKLPLATIKIVNDPEKPSRPKVILPTKAELEEMLLKEHRAKIKPFIKEGMMYPEKAFSKQEPRVIMPEGIANICADYVGLEEEPLKP